MHSCAAATGSNNALGPLYFATFCALSVTLGALLYNLTDVLNEYFTLQQQLTSKQQVGLCAVAGLCSVATWLVVCLCHTSKLGLFASQQRREAISMLSSATAVMLW